MDPNAWRSLESEIVPDLEHSNNHGGKSCTKQSGRFTLDVPTAFHLENISWQRMNKRCWTRRHTKQKKARERGLVG